MTDDVKHHPTGRFSNSDLLFTKGDRHFQKLQNGTALASKLFTGSFPCVRVPGIREIVVCASQCTPAIRSSVVRIPVFCRFVTSRDHDKSDDKRVWCRIIS